MVYLSSLDISRHYRNALLVRVRNDMPDSAPLPCSRNIVPASRPWTVLYFPLRPPASTATAFSCLDDATVVRSLQMNMERATLRGVSEGGLDLMQLTPGHMHTVLTSTLFLIMH